MFVFFDDEAKPADTKSTAPGQVQFDARGNAVYAWRDDLLEQSGTADHLAERALLNSKLKLVDDNPAVAPSGICNDKGLQVGYNPYQSGLLAGKKTTAKKTDMRELSKWIEMKRRMGAQPSVASKK